MLTAGRLFCAIPASASSRTFLTFALLSLAVTGSVAGAVALLGPAGVNLGTLYFLFGLIVSGASILPEFLPPVGRRLGQALPPGAGATAIRDSLYFPAAPSRGAVLVLTAYAGVGLLAVLLSNTAANHTGRPFLLHRSQRPSNADTA